MPWYEKDLSKARPKPLDPPPKPASPRKITDEEIQEAKRDIKDGFGIPLDPHKRRVYFSVRFNCTNE